MFEYCNKIEKINLSSLVEVTKYDGTMFQGLEQPSIVITDCTVVNSYCLKIPSVLNNIPPENPPEITSSNLFCKCIKYPNSNYSTFIKGSKGTNNFIEEFSLFYYNNDKT